MPQAASAELSLERLQEELRASQRYFESILENIPAMVFVKRADDFRFHAINRYGEELLGMSRAELLGKTDYDFCSKEEADFFRQHDIEALEGRRMVDIIEPLNTRYRGKRMLHTKKLPILGEDGRPRFMLGISEDITDRLRAEEELRRTNQFLDSIVENIPNMIFVKEARSLKFVRFNRAGEELLGWSRTELVGKSDQDFYPMEQAEFFHQMDRQALAAKTLVDIPAEPIQTRYGGERILHTKKIPIRDEQGDSLYLLGISEDITAQRAAEQASRELAALIENARDAIIAWSPEGRIVSWNPAAERLFGLPATSAAGRLVLSFVPEIFRADFLAAQKRLLAGENVPAAEVSRLRADGLEIEIEESLFVVRDAAGEPARIAAIARDLSELARLRRATEILGSAGVDADEMPTRSPRMREVIEAADLAAGNAAVTLLLLGETGAGKGWLARRIHARSPRASQPFFEVNCAGLSPSLVESELFGHERGAFTGATSQKRGLVEAAAGGTLFLDEIGDLPLPVQAQLLTFLDSRVFRRVGGSRTMTADVRLVAATNLDLKQAVEKGTFRRDLYYRLSVMPLVVPPLRERPEDIPFLAARMLAELGRGSGRRGTPLGPKMLSSLQRYAWPGNVRELRNTLERALLLSRGGTIEPSHLPPEIRDSRRSPVATDALLESLERDQIVRVLAEVGGNRTQAAKRLGISLSTLKRRLAEMRGSVPDDVAAAD
jgi:PAS domain S-box-containing protein